MKARNRFTTSNGFFSPTEVSVIFGAFDEAWKVLSRELPNNLAAKRSARLQLADLVLSLARNGVGDQQSLAQAALRLMAVTPQS